MIQQISIWLLIHDIKVNSLKRKKNLGTTYLVQLLSTNLSLEDLQEVAQSLGTTPNEIEVTNSNLHLSLI